MGHEAKLNQINQKLTEIRAESTSIREDLKKLNQLNADISRRVSDKLSVISDIEGNELLETTLRGRVEILANELVAAYGMKSLSNPPVFVSLMSGALPFADWLQEALARRGFPVEISTMKVTSYAGTQSGELSIASDFSYPVGERDVFILDDIVDTGKTSDAVKAFLIAKGAASTCFVALVDKQGVRFNVQGEEDLTNKPEHAAFKVENQFLMGAGMDYNNLGRYLKDGGIKAVTDYSTLTTEEEQVQLNQIKPLNQRLIDLIAREAVLCKQEAWCIQRIASQSASNDSNTVVYFSRYDGALFNNFLLEDNQTPENNVAHGMEYK